MLMETIQWILEMLKLFFLIVVILCGVKLILNASIKSLKEDISFIKKAISKKDNEI